MKSKIVTVNILGQEYQLKTDAKEKYIQDVAKYVDKVMTQIKDAMHDQSTQQLRVAVLACMNITDEYFSSIKETKHIISNLHNRAMVIDEYVDETINQIKP